MKQPFTPLKKSLIFAADLSDLETLRDFAKSFEAIPGLSAFKVGLTLGLQNISEAVRIVKSGCGKKMKVIYDHQKAGNDIPEMGLKFAKQLKKAGVDVVILFPFTGPVTQKEWTLACIGEGLQVMTGGIMTHSRLLWSEGGYIANDAPERIYKYACELDCEHFVVPGNRVEWVVRIREWLTNELGDGNYTVSAPGFITQGGDLSECGKVAGDNFHPIVGSAIYNATYPSAVADMLARKILALG